MSRPTGRAFGAQNTLSQLSVHNDVFMGNSFDDQTPPPRRRRRECPANPFADEEEVNEVTSSQLGAVLKEFRELKEMVQEVNTRQTTIEKRQTTIEKSLNRLTKQMDQKEFDLAKSTHANNVTKILAKAYVQVGRFTKTNESKTVSTIKN